MSVEYYAQLERGALAGVSAGVLDALARALQLDDAERVHLLRLAHEADGSSRIIRRPQPKQWSIRPSLQWTLDAITTAPAIVGKDRLDFLPPTNSAGRCTPTCSWTPALRRTSPDTSSSTRPPGAHQDV